jgi:DNA primase
MGDVVLAFDGDEAGDKAMQNAMLNLLNLEPDVTNFLRVWAVEGKPYRDAILSLGNEALAEEYQSVSRMASNREFPDWLRDGLRQDAYQCMNLINYRSAQLTRAGNGVDQIKDFNSEHSISSVLASYGYPGVPGRSVRCPKHDDSSPSLSISRDDGRAYCFNQSCILWHDGYGVDAYELDKILSGE